MCAIKIALHVITAAGYGCRFEWESSDVVPPGHRLSFRDSIHITLNNLITLVVVPPWLRKLPIKRLRETQLAYVEFGRYLQDLVDLGKRDQGHKSGIGEDNIINVLVRQSIEDHNLSGRVLTDEEVIGNAFIFLLAGHDSTYIPSVLTLG
jgi:cytochrome P450